MWIFLIMTGLCLGAWIGAKYSITILTVALFVCDAGLLAGGLAAGWSMLHLALVLFTVTITLQAGYFAAMAHHGGLVSSRWLHALRSVTGGSPKF